MSSSEPSYPGPSSQYGQPQDRPVDHQHGAHPVPSGPQAAGAPPGWYPTTPGWQQYWDGWRWTEHQAPLTPAGPTRSEDTTLALLVHLGGAFGSILLPLLIYAVKKDESSFIRHHALEAINFHVTFYLIAGACFLLAFVVIGLLLLPLVIVAFLVLSIVAATAASRGEWYRYPATLRIFT